MGFFDSLWKKTKKETKKVASKTKKAAKKEILMHLQVLDLL